MKNILFLSGGDINPFDPTFGGAQRTNNLLRACAKLGHVDVLCFKSGITSNIKGCDVIYSESVTGRPEERSRIKKWGLLLNPCNPYSIFPINRSMEKIVDDFMSKMHYDAIVVRYYPLAMACGVMKYADRLMIDIDDHPADMLKNEAKKIKRIGNKLYHNIASLFSRITLWSVSNKIKATLFPNPAQVIGKHSYLLPNIAFEETATELADFNATNHRLLFVGCLDHEPNYTGLDHFVDNVWDKIREVIPDAELHIVGKIVRPSIAAPHISKWEKVSGVKVLGFVPSLQNEYKDCRATIVPIYWGAGTNIKLLESMQYKRACVTTECGIRGMKKCFTRDEDVLVARDDNDYADKIIRMLTDEPFNHMIAQNGYLKNQKYFSRQHFDEVIYKILTQ